MTEPTTDRHTCHGQRAATGPAWKCPHCSAAPLQPSVLSAETLREQLLVAIDGTRVPPLGYASKDALLAAYDASRTNTTAERIEVWPLVRVLAEVRCGSRDWTWDEEWADLDRRHAETGYLAKLEQQIRENGITMPVLVGSDGRLWDGHHRLRIAARLGIGYVPVELTSPAPVPPAADATAAAVLAVVEAAGGDTLTRDARVEALAALAAVLPATTRHDTDTSVTPPPALTEEGRLRARVQVLEEDAERDQGLAATGARCLLRGHQGQIESGRATIEGHRFALSTTLGLGTGAPWDAIHERVAELRRVADETAATETPECAAVIARVRAITERAANNVQRPAARLARRILAELPDQGACPPRCPCHQPAAGARQDGAQR
ncbi:hypothetical protein [Streptomyces olivaceus]